MNFVQSFVQLPQAEITALTVLIVSGVGIVFKLVAAQIPWLADFLAKYQGEIGASIAAFLIQQLQNALPDAHPEISVLAVQLGIAILTAFVFKFAKNLLARAKVKGFVE